MPVTPYRSFPASEVQVARCQRTVLGIDGMMSDTASLHVLLNSLVDRSRYPDGAIQFRYTLVTEDAVVAGNQMMARWVMTTLNATQFGTRMEVSKRGMLCCKFNSAHKITGLELMFDVMAFMLQLKQASGTDTFAVVPNTVQTCQRPFDSPMVMTLAERPYTIVQVNKLWEEMTGWKAEDVVGKASCRILQGQETDRAAAEALISSVRNKHPASFMVANYSCKGRRFRNYMNVYPLSTDSKITHYVGLTCHLDWIDKSHSSNHKEASAEEVASATSVVLVDLLADGETTQSLKPTRVESSVSATAVLEPKTSNNTVLIAHQEKRSSSTDLQQHGKNQVLNGGNSSQPQGAAARASQHGPFISGCDDNLSSLTSPVSRTSSQGSSGGGDAKRAVLVPADAELSSSLGAPPQPGPSLIHGNT